MKRSTVVVAIVAGLAITLSADSRTQSPQDSADLKRLVEVLHVRTGSVIADIGAAAGGFTLLFSPVVGPSGRLFANELDKDRLNELRAAVAKRGLTNVTPIEGDANRTNLPDGCCDAIFMRHVYHHLGDPQAMNRSLLQSLKPGGLLAVSDFPPTSKRTAPAGKRGDGDDHGVMPATMLEELVAAGFINVREEPWSSPRGFLVVAEKKRSNVSSPLPIRTRESRAFPTYPPAGGGLFKE
jgi:SAM-dependent methyltransferase